MFGQFYFQRDSALGRGGDRPHIPIASYAAVVLAELLDRASMLAVVRRVSDDDGRDKTLAAAVDVFLLDVAEARARGLRARLFCRTESGGLDAWSVDPTDSLDDLGGELVSPARASGAE